MPIHQLDDRPGQPQIGSGPCLVASYGDVKKARRVGYGRLVFLEHGIAQTYVGVRHGSYSGGPDRGDVALFLVPNEQAAAKWRSAYPAARVEIVGSPRLDDLPRGPRRSAPPTGKDAVVAISFHWVCTVAPETQPAFSHYRLVLSRLAERFTVLGHAHPRFLDRIRHYYEHAGIEVVADFAEVCERADLYVCDNSSTLYEFAATARPVVVLNAPWYRRNVEHGLRFWEAAHVGLQVNEPADLVPTVERALTDPWPDEREDALRIAYAYRTGAAERAARAIMALDREAVAA